MKTLLVISALVALTAAAPTTPDNQTVRPINSNHKDPVTSLRKKKSILHEKVPVADEPAHLVDEANVSEAITLGLKKIQSQLRDSSEEKPEADSKELCTKEVKVKFCENEHAQQTGALNHMTIEDSPKPIPDSDLKENIKMAKEVVESIQKMTQAMGESANGAEIYDDIEKAKQALAHMEKNLVQLESLSLHVARLDEAEDFHESHLETSESENQRMAQWKGIQKSLEEPKNLEESLNLLHKSSVEEVTLPKQLESARLAVAPDSDKFSEGKSGEHNLVPTLKSNVPEDPTIAASELVESVAELKEKSSANNELLEPIDEPMAKIVQPKELVSTNESEQSKFSIQEKSAVSGDLFARKEADKPEIFEFLPVPVARLPVEETIIDPDSAASETIMKSVPVENTVVESNHLTEQASKNTIEPMKSAAEGLPETHDDKKTEEEKNHSIEDLMPFMRSNDDKTSKVVIATQNQEEGIKMVKAANEEELNLFTTKSVDLQKEQQVKHQIPKEKNEEIVTVEQFGPSEPQPNWSPIIKAAEPEPHHGFHSAGISETFHTQSHHHHGVSSSHQLGHHHHHLGHLHHGHPIFKGTDMDGAQSTQMNVQEASERNMMKGNPNPNHKSALDKNMLLWKHNNGGTARGAYGAAGGYGIGSTSAVFPGAKNSPCAIPLMLSCSPSVTFGEHESHSFGLPAYRSDSSNFHHKRDTKKAGESKTTKVKRTSNTSNVNMQH